MDVAGRFTAIYDRNEWCSAETRSGGGSEYARTEAVRAGLVPLLERFDVTSLLDAGCGDWNWQRHVDWRGIEYTGVDVVPAMVSDVARRHGGPGRTFYVADITRDALPSVDAILCRAVLFHLSLAHAAAALENFRRSARLFIATTHTQTTQNVDIEDGDWRRLNLRLPPFTLSQPDEVLHNDGGDGHLAVWTL